MSLELFIALFIKKIFDNTFTLELAINLVTRHHMSDCLEVSIL